MGRSPRATPLPGEAVEPAAVRAAPMELGPASGGARCYRHAAPTGAGAASQKRQALLEQQRRLGRCEVTQTTEPAPPVARPLNALALLHPQNAPRLLDAAPVWTLWPQLYTSIIQRSRAAAAAVGAATGAIHANSQSPIIADSG